LPDAEHDAAVAASMKLTASKAGGVAVREVPVAPSR
jgi:hypothetical protein